MKKDFMLSGWGLKEKNYKKELVQGWSRSKQMAAFFKGGGRLEKNPRENPGKKWGCPTTPKNWCIKEVLWHLADQEANLYVRLRRAAAEPGKIVAAYDQEKWSTKLLYKKADPQQAKVLILLLRKANADLVKRLPSKVWNHKVKHSEWGMLTFGFMMS